MPIDYSKYPPNWKTEIRPRILERAGNKCEFCGDKNYSIIKKNKWINRKKSKVILTIAHLDHDETNWDVSDDRLAALCQRCHLSYDAAEKQRRRKAKEELAAPKFL